MNVYKKNVVERLGGSCHFDMIIFHMCERMIEDIRLKKYYGPCHVDDLFELQQAVMELATRDFSDEENHVKFYDRTTLQHYHLFLLGLNISHFDVIKSHLLDSLQYFWCDADVVEDILDLFEPLRISFYNKGGTLTNTSNKNNYDEDDEEFELPLKKATTALSAAKESKTVKKTYSGQSLDKMSTIKKGIRQLSGENLLNLLKLNRTKRTMSSSQ